MAWGDSLTQGTGSTATTGPYPYRLALRTSRAVRNEGSSGETSTQLKARMALSPGLMRYPTIIWIGRNDHADPPGVLSNIASIISTLGHTNYLVLSVLNASTEPAGHANYVDVATINAGLASTYGVRYLDVRSYLVSLYNPSIPQDVTDHTNDVVPSSLRSDTLHLNDAGYQAVANLVYANRAQLGLN